MGEAALRFDSDAKIIRDSCYAMDEHIMIVEVKHLDKPTASPEVQQARTHDFEVARPAILPTCRFSLVMSICM